MYHRICAVSGFYWVCLCYSRQKNPSTQVKQYSNAIWWANVSSYCAFSSQPISLLLSTAFCLFRFSTDRLTGTRYPTIPWDQDQARGVSSQTSAVGASQFDWKEWWRKCWRFGGRLHTVTYLCMCVRDIVFKLERNLQDAKVLTAKLVAWSTFTSHSLDVAWHLFKHLRAKRYSVINIFPFTRGKKTVLHKSFAKHFRFLQPQLKE